MPLSSSALSSVFCSGLAPFVRGPKASFSLAQFYQQLLHAGKMASTNSLTRITLLLGWFMNLSKLIQWLVDQTLTEVSRLTLYLTCKLIFSTSKIIATHILSRTQYCPQTPLPLFCLIASILVCFLLLWQTPWPIANYGGKSFFLLTSSAHNPYLREIGQELEAETTEECCLLALSWTQASFLI